MAEPQGSAHQGRAHPCPGSHQSPWGAPLAQAAAGPRSWSGILTGGKARVGRPGVLDILGVGGLQSLQQQLMKCGENPPAACSPTEAGAPTLHASFLVVLPGPGGFGECWAPHQTPILSLQKGVTWNT